MSLIESVLMETPAYTASTVTCDDVNDEWSTQEEVGAFGVVLVRAGSFTRRVDNTEHSCNASVVYFERPGEVQQFRHDDRIGDTCTYLHVHEGLHPTTRTTILDAPYVYLSTTPRIEYLHQRLLTKRSPSFDESDANDVILQIVEELSPVRRRMSEPVLKVQTVKDRERLCKTVQELIWDSPNDASLQSLAGRNNVSTYHLSRVFREQCGFTVSQYRRRVRACLAVRAVAGGATDLAGLAVRLGFSDHSHLTRTVVSEIGINPRDLRAQLGLRVPRETSI